MAELHLRDVHRHREVEVAGRAQAHQLRAGFAQHPFADLDDQARVLGDRDEAVRRTSGRPPVRQRSSASAPNGRLRGQVDLRLVGEEQFAAREAAAQRVHQAHPLADLDAHAAREIEVAAALLGLGALEGDVGILQRVGAAAVVFLQAHQAEGARHLHVLAVDRERRLEQRVDRFRVCSGVAQHAKMSPPMRATVRRGPERAAGAAPRPPAAGRRTGGRGRRWFRRSGRGRPGTAWPRPPPGRRPGRRRGSSTRRVRFGRLGQRS
jgi:hypothetical protein